jgi:hypothetical protein
MISRYINIQMFSVFLLRLFEISRCFSLDDLEGDINKVEIFLLTYFESSREEEF